MATTIFEKEEPAELLETVPLPDTDEEVQNVALNALRVFVGFTVANSFKEEDEYVCIGGSPVFHLSKILKFQSKSKVFRRFLTGTWIVLCNALTKDRLSGPGHV